MRIHFIYAILPLFVVVIGGCSKPSAVPEQSLSVVKPASPANVIANSESDLKTYVSAMSSASNNAADASGALEALVRQYSDNQQIRHDKAWRVEVANTILQVDKAASRFENLPSAPKGLKHVNSLLHEAAKEMHIACISFAKALETGDTSLLDKATKHQRRVQDLATQVGREFHDFAQARQ